jgi:hypothetical protein
MRAAIPVILDTEVAEASRTGIGWKAVFGISFDAMLYRNIPAFGEPVDGDPFQAASRFGPSVVLSIWKMARPESARTDARMPDARVVKLHFENFSM